MEEKFSVLVSKGYLEGNFDLCIVPLTPPQSLLKKGIDAEGVVVGPLQPGKAIVKYAQDNAIDLICIATHGRSG
ncbi:MAG: universal stress protein, partial [Candidatus Wukongarchaeota archaeon]|nr:universal stress protein [Candidatus Wukongarchaeota archaeon]